MDINMTIKQIIYNSNKNTKYYLQGGCYIFAKLLQNIIGGNILYLLDEFHFVVKHNNKLYDVSGNVTNKYKSSKYISENDFLQRKRLTKEFTLD